MHIVDEYINEPFYSSPDFDRYFGDARMAVFDIETTGLGSGRSKIIIGGVLTPDINGVRLRQFFSEGAQDEGELLDLYADVLRNTDVVFSYNGDGFDIPFVNARLKAKHKLGVFHECLSIDMYKVVRSHSDLGSKLPNLKQKTVENYLALWKSRSDRISGAESVSLYYEYLVTRSDKLLNYLLLHNSDDVLQLARILKIFDSLDVHEVFSNMGFPVMEGESSLFVEKIWIKNGILEFSGRYKSLPFDYIVFDEAFQAVFRNEDCTFYFKIPCMREKGIVAADLMELGLADHKDFRNRPELLSGFLVLKQRSSHNYEVINLLVKLVIKLVLNSMKKA